MANKRKTSNLISGFIRVLRRYLLNKGIYSSMDEAKNCVIPGQLMDYSTPMKKPHISVVRSSTMHQPLTLNNEITRRFPRPNEQTMAPNPDGSVLVESNLLTTGTISIIVYHTNILELENTLDDLVELLAGFVRFLEEELKVQNFSLPQVSETNYLEDNRKVWTASITIQYNIQYKYTLEIKRDVYRDFFLDVDPEA